MSARAKFLFDVDFGSGDGAEAPRQTVALAEHEAALAEARAQGYRQGVAAAEAKALAEAERRAASALERIGAGLGGLGQGLAGVAGRLEAEAVEVAVAVARKLAAELIAREPFAELAALAADCFRHLVSVPHAVVRVSDALYPAVREHLEATARTSGFDGRLVVLAEPDIAPGDCRIEWADGGVIRDRAATQAAIDEAVARYVAVRRGAPSR